jgi:hypothetical protein
MQRILNFPMVILAKRNVPNRLVVISSDGSVDIETVVAALLDILVDSDGKESNAINCTTCGNKDY